MPAPQITQISQIVASRCRDSGARSVLRASHDAPAFAKVRAPESRPKLFPEELQTWEPVAQKSRQWLFGFISRFRAKVDDRDIRDWAERFVQGHVRFPGQGVPEGAAP